MSVITDLSLDNLQNVLLIDFVVFIGCSLMLIRYGRIRHSHPGTIYLIFHLFAFTTRVLAIILGSPTLFSERWDTEGVTHYEIARAVLIADFSLVIMTAAWVYVSRKDLKRYGPLPKTGNEGPETLSKRIVWLVVAFALPIGLVGLALFARLPGKPTVYVPIEMRTGWIGMTQLWAGLALIALVYIYGFRWIIVIPLAGYLFIQMVHGGGRFRFVLPVLLLCQIYLDRKGSKWPAPRVALILGLVALIFFPMKSIGRMYQQGMPLNEIYSHSSEVIKEVFLGRGEQVFLDEYAAMLTLIDEKAKWYFGRKWFYSVAIMWIPRPLWPDKPHMGGFIYEISKPSRPVAEMGMITTYLGDAYANFRYIGIVLVSFFLAYWSAKGYFRAYRSNYYSLARFSYLLLACNLIQVYRDGLKSIVTFIAANMMPLFIIVLLHIAFAKFRKNRGENGERSTWLSTKVSTNNNKINH
jgi:hypothetical protein